MFKIATAPMYVLTCLLGLFTASAAEPVNTNVIVRTIVSIDYNDEGGYSGVYVTNKVAVPINWDAARAKLNITARMTKNKQMVAVVNGQMVSAGHAVVVENEGLVYTWRLKSITKDAADWEPVTVADSHRGGVKK